MIPKEQLLERYKIACDFKQEVKPEIIELKIREFCAGLGVEIESVKEVGSFDSAWVARVARDARDARAARAAWAAWAARAARAARELSYISTIILGACELRDERTYNIWLPFFEALEAGCFAIWLGDKEAVWIRIPILKTEMFDGKKRCHADGEPAFILPNEKLYFLHGVMVPEYLAMTPTEKLDMEFFKKEKNADVKAEFIRKFGIERMKGIGKIVDSYKNYSDKWFIKSQYELVDMSPVFSKLQYAPYLSMKNQSVPGVFHMEAVPKSVKTVKEAIEFRTKTKNPNIINIK